MNPFAAPQRVFVSASPCDMRAGILTLAERVSSQLGRDPSDGSLYCFVSRDCRKCKMVRFDDGAWCMWYVRPCEGTFPGRSAAGPPSRSSAGSSCGSSRASPWTSPAPTGCCPEAPCFRQNSDLAGIL